MEHMQDSRRRAAEETELREERRFVRAAYLERLAPVSMSVLLVQLCSIVNNLIVGRVIGSDGLAVMSAVNPVYFACATMGALLSTGGSTLAARRIGANGAASVDGAFSASVFALVCAGACMTALGLAFRGALLSALGVPDNLREMADAYIAWYLPGAIGVMGIYIPFNYLKLVGKQNQSVLLFAVMAIVTAGLDLVLAGGMGMGMRGVAIATAAGAWTAFLLGMVFLCGKGGEFRLRRIPDAVGTLGQIVRFGSPYAMNNLCSLLFTLCLNRVIFTALGGMGLAAFSLAMTVRSFSMAINNGVSMNMAPFAAVFSSERDSESLRQLLRCALTSGILLMLVFAGAVVAFPAQVCVLFGIADPEKMAVAVPALRMFALSMPIALVNYTLIAFYANGGRTLLSNAMTVLRAFALVVPLAVALTALAGGETVFWAFALAEALTLLAGLGVARGISRKQAHVSPFALIDTRYEDEGRYLAFSVASTDAAASESAQRVSEFCEQNDLPPKTTMAIGLALEEMLVILNKHALHADGKRADVRASTVRLLIYQADTVILRLRCFGTPFDPIKAAEADDDAVGEYLGIRMIKKLAETVVYTHTFGINNLTITI